MDDLLEVIQSTPIIDHHAHNLLLPSKINAHDLRSITSEASGQALDHSLSTLSHLRAVKQLAEILCCEPTWNAVKAKIELKRQEPDDSWARQCFSGIETVLIDDGLNSSDVQGYAWHDRLTRSKCRRIVRIEHELENIVVQMVLHFRSQDVSKEHDEYQDFTTRVVRKFKAIIQNAIRDPEVSGFKSVISGCRSRWMIQMLSIIEKIFCHNGVLLIPGYEGYRTGLAITEFEDIHETITTDDWKLPLAREDWPVKYRLDNGVLNPFFVHLTAQLLTEYSSKKPFQFHTGLGDNDIKLELSNPSYLQGFIESYPKVPIVLLHASYPFTAEAGYLASVYENAYLDIGEVFPFVSQDGQEGVIRNALHLCPSEKLLWSTDGHSFPETYLLAVLQMREGLSRVLSEYVARGSLTATQAIRIVQDLLFDTSNKLYNLGLDRVPIQHRTSIPSTPNTIMFEQFMAQNPAVRFLRLQWLDYTSTLRARVLPINQALKLLCHGQYIGITKAVLGLLQVDIMCPGFSAIGEYRLYPQFSGIRLASRSGHATVQCEFQEKNGEEVLICPRTLLRKQVERAKHHGVEFLVGFEVEVVFMRIGIVHGEFEYGGIPVNEGGHAWSAARALQRSDLMDLLETIAAKLESAGIELQQFHPESSPGQYEFVLGPLRPLDAVDALLAAREIISLAAADADMRATLYPKPEPERCGNGAHVHMSMTPSEKWPSFYSAILNHLEAIAAFTYSNDASYERLVDGAWAGSTWIAWGCQNRETPLRQISGSHFEIKCMDGLANPYLALAAIIGAGLHGIQHEASMTMKPCPGDPGQLSQRERKDLGIRAQFPKSIAEALKCLEEDQELVDVLGRDAVRTYTAVKKEEAKLLEQMGAFKRKNWLIERY